MVPYYGATFRCRCRSQREGFPCAGRADSALDAVVRMAHREYQKLLCLEGVDMRGTDMKPLAWLWFGIFAVLWLFGACVAHAQATPTPGILWTAQGGSFATPHLFRISAIDGS